ncbi:acyltransferase [Sphingomonas koreensis]|jgi:peptidoglycan/LPS O-acetylase OafA/YrhL|uniref:Acyltransferase n=1 Tax=Sphingomonas koreensis TaxID=93064 RepID=A0A430FXE5_9SPHN|nr:MULTISPECIES: acyltransferase [Sphingomonas]MDK2770410.1 acyltransferase [Sphingomonas sp.]RSY76359.1 acyltransferase [Sphingomonas koreensis]
MSSISINDVIALRNDVLDKNAALRNVASNPNSVSVSGAARGAAFDAAMNTALGKADSPNSVSGVRALPSYCLHGAEKDRRRESGPTASSEQNRGRGDQIPGQGAFTIMDAMRCVLAVVVAFAHAWYLLIEDYRGQASIAASAGYFLAGYAHASVILFFVLSGFWIARSVDGRVGDWHWSSYLIDRLARLLVVLLPALAIGGALDAIGVYVLGSSTHLGTTDTYVLRKDVTGALDWPVLLGNILFLQGIVVAPFGTNGPLWSLAYEFWFYIWFPAIVISWRLRRLSIFLVFIGLAWISPFMVIGFGCWLCGAALHRLTKTHLSDFRRVPIGRIWLVVAGGILITTLVVVRIVGLGGLELVLAGAFTLFLYILLRKNPPSPRWLRSFASYGAKASFSLYALHFPIMAFVAALLLDSERLPPAADNIALVGFTLALAVVTCGLFAFLTERHTARIRSFFYAKLLSVQKAQDRRSVS